MTATLQQRPAGTGTGNGGVPARRAVIRWAWRMFRREWRQQLLVLALIIVAVAATIVGAAVATNTPPQPNSGFGTAHDQAIYSGGPHVASQIAALQHRFGPADVIENQAMSIPGSIDTFDLRAQNPHGPFGQPMLALVSGHYPAGPHQVAVTDGVASAFKLHAGSVWRLDGTPRTVVGIVAEPAEPAGRVRPRRAGPGPPSVPGHRAVQRTGGAAPLHRRERADSRVGAGQ